MHVQPISLLAAFTFLASDQPDATHVSDGAF
jgi:hypothetical protein